MALTGGADAPIALGIVKGFLLMKILTESWNHDPERGSRPFSVDRDGFVLGEGAWMFVLEEYEHARTRGAKMLAEVCGYGSTCEAFHRVRLAECGEEPLPPRLVCASDISARFRWMRLVTGPKAHQLHQLVGVDRLADVVRRPGG